MNWDKIISVTCLLVIVSATRMVASSNNLFNYNWFVPESCETEWWTYCIGPKECTKYTFLILVDMPWGTKIRGQSSPWEVYQNTALKNLNISWRLLTLDFRTTKLPPKPELALLRDNFVRTSWIPVFGSRIVFHLFELIQRKLFRANSIASFRFPQATTKRPKGFYW